jgi:hypothetical protein
LKTNHARLIVVIVGANIAGGLITLGLGSALFSHSVNFLQAGCILLGLALNMSVATALGTIHRVLSTEST